jgi:hypothetical protein
MAREQYLFPPEEDALKAKQDSEPVASEAAMQQSSDCWEASIREFSP